MISKKKFIIYTLLVGGTTFLLAGFLLRPISFDSLRNQITIRILSKEGTLIGRGKNQNQTKQDWENVEEYPSFVPEILKIAEDKRFDVHHGVDILAGFNSLYSYFFPREKGEELLLLRCNWYEFKILKFGIILFYCERAWK